MFGSRRFVEGTVVALGIGHLLCKVKLPEDASVTGVSYEPNTNGMPIVYRLTYRTSGGSESFALSYRMGATVNGKVVKSVQAGTRETLYGSLCGLCDTNSLEDGWYFLYGV